MADDDDLHHLEDQLADTPEGLNFGITFDDVPDGWQAVAGIAILKCFDEDGEMRLVSVVSAGLSEWEAIGMLTVDLHSRKVDVAEGMEDD